MSASIFVSMSIHANPLFGLCLSADKTKYLCTRDSIPTFITSFDLDGNEDPNPFLTSTNPNPPFNSGAWSGLCVSNDRQYYLVANFDNNFIFKIDLVGNYIGIFLDNNTKLPDGSSPLCDPSGICLSADEKHYLIANNSTFNNYGIGNIIKVDLDGQNPVLFISNLFASAISLSFDKTFYLISLYDSSTIIKVDLYGQNQTVFLDTTLRLPNGTQAIDGPYGVLQISETKVLISNYDRNNIILYDSSPTLECFGENTKILTNKGYTPIKELRKGDLIKTLNNGFVPIHMIGYKDLYISGISEERTKNKLYVCSKENYPEIFEDLIITGCHSILVDDFKDDQRDRTLEILSDIYVTDNKYRLPACIDDRTKLSDISGMFMIWHFALENENYFGNYGIWANGLLVETCSKRYLTEISDMIIK